MIFEDRNEYLRIYLNADQGYANYHYFWLRHNCPCCIHPSTKERILCPSKVPLDIRPQNIAARADGSGIELTWEDGHETCLSLAWLATQAYSTNEDIFQIQSQDLSQIQLDYADCAEDLVSTCKVQLEEKGAVLVRACGLSTEALVKRLTEQIFTLRDSHFGYIEDLRTDNTTNKNTDQLGYTNAGIDLHTDQPFIENPPRFQILQCVQKADVGGESILADAQQAAYYLRQLDAHAVQVLSTTPVVFHRQQQAFQSKTTYPIVRFNADRFVQVRSSYFTIAPQVMDFNAMEQWYRAYQKFTRIVEHPAYQYRFALNPQDFILYDNYRMLHGRTAFSGPRWMKGIYLDYR